jgi:Protein of unknown function (DUF3313)
MKFDAAKPQLAALILLAVCMSGCAHAPVQPSGFLSSYQGMTQESDMLAYKRSMGRSDAVVLEQARTVSLVPIAFTAAAAHAGLSAEHQVLVANATNRALCNELSRKFTIVPEGQPADLMVRGAITKVMPTDAGAAAVSQVGSVATSVLAPVPVPLPRLPIGLGAVTIEAEALAPGGAQVAGIVWESDANPFASKPRASPAGDAYDLATSFSTEFARVLKRTKFGWTPEAMLASLPTPDEVVANVSYAVDGKASAPACEVYGNGPGLIGSIAGNFGAPPEWTDTGKRQGQPQ